MSGITRRAVVFACVFALGACSGLPGFRPTPGRLVLPAPPAAFHLEGRVSVKAETESFSGGLVWRRDARSQELLLRTPLGQGVAELRGDQHGMSLTDAKGHAIHAADPDALVRQALGVDLPLRGLQWWVVGQPRPGEAFHAQADAEGRLSALTQDGWHIDYSRHVLIDGHPLPGRLIARRGDQLELRLVIDVWELP